MESTERLSLPLLLAGQAQKEVYHNGALLALDAIVAAAVEEPARDDPPAAPTAGRCYLVGTNPSGEWSQHPDHIAAFTSGGWRFIAPLEGMAVTVKTTRTTAAFGPGGWETGVVRAGELVVNGDKVVGARSAAIPDPTGGSTVDTEARAAIAQLLGALRQHGLISL